MVINIKRGYIKKIRYERKGGGILDLLEGNKKYKVVTNTRSLVPQ
jgi:hypothetical protein